MQLAWPNNSLHLTRRAGRILEFKLPAPAGQVSGAFGEVEAERW
jgi:hypothetical protein